MVLRSKGKGLVTPCLVCGENRFSDDAHFPKRNSKGGEDTIKLCPTHHRLLDNGRLSKGEYEVIWKNSFADKASSVEEFIQWAVKNGYQYDLESLERKFWRN